MVADELDYVVGVDTHRDGARSCLGRDPCMTWFVRATGHELSPEIAIRKVEWATNGPQRPRKGFNRDNATGRFAGKRP